MMNYQSLNAEELVRVAEMSEDPLVLALCAKLEEVNDNMKDLESKLEDLLDAGYE